MQTPADFTWQAEPQKPGKAKKSVLLALAVGGMSAYVWHSSANVQSNPPDTLTPTPAVMGASNPATFNATAGTSAELPELLRHVEPTPKSEYPGENLQRKKARRAKGMVAAKSNSAPDYAALRQFLLQR